MKLFGNHISPYVRMCRMTLLEENLTFEFIETTPQESAQHTPTKKIPFFQDGEITLTDSASIIKYIREKSDKPCLSNAQEIEAFTLINTSMDSCINVFLLERDGITLEQSPYLKRQKARIESIFFELNKLNLATTAPYNDIEIRLACYIDWGLYRNRISISAHKNLLAFMNGIKSYPPFIDTPLPPT